jgi:shikimate kinase
MDITAHRRPSVVAHLPGSIFLVGLMGAGKTSVGRLLAKRLGKRFVDSDHEIEARTGVRIPVIFEIEGEAGFRQRETAMIDELTRHEDIVLATGGGAVMDGPTGRRCIPAARSSICVPTSTTSGIAPAGTAIARFSRPLIRAPVWRS